LSRRWNARLRAPRTIKASRTNQRPLREALDAPWPHHKVPVKHTLRECRLMKNYVKSTLKPKTTD
jgi:hypothetical protein